MLNSLAKWYRSDPALNYADLGVTLFLIVLAAYFVGLVVVPAIAGVRPNRPPLRPVEPPPARKAQE